MARIIKCPKNVHGGWVDPTVKNYKGTGARIDKYTKVCSNKLIETKPPVKRILVNTKGKFLNYIKTKISQDGSKKDTKECRSFEKITPKTIATIAIKK